MATQLIKSLATTTSSHKVPVASGTRYSLGTCNVKKSYTTMKFQGKRHNCQMQNDYLRVGMFRSQNTTNVVNAACVSNELFPTDRTRASATNLVKSAFNGMDILFRFSRPYAAIATVLSVLSTSLLAVESRSDLSSLFFVKVFQRVKVDNFLHLHTSLEREKLRKVKEVGHPSSMTLVIDGRWQIRRGLQLDDEDVAD
ncbi:putative homogentisate phytyltransferase [Helianthus annuus]|nr:putative homogentisate phytyltransferase [Helianthus annuus]